MLDSVRSHTPSWNSWESTSTCSSVCAWHDPSIREDAPQPHQGWANPGRGPGGPSPDDPWSLPLDLHSAWAPPSPPRPCMVLPSSPERIHLVRGARGKRPSVLAALIKGADPPCSHAPTHLSRRVSAPPGPDVDADAFRRYYETGGARPPARHAHSATSNGSSASRIDRDGETKCTLGQGIGGSLASLASLGLALPNKLEGLLKLLAQSLHLVIAALCSRKARRKDRDCPSSQDQESKLYLEKEVLERNIPETDLRHLVELPPGLGYEEWLASHTIDFFHHINLLYGTVCEFCTLTGCPDMVGPAMKHYLWQDEKGKKTRVAAPQYVDYVMTFTQNTVNDESVFPTKFENEFPSCFETLVKKIHRLLFHVLAHLYHSHFRELVVLSLHSHLNCIFAHFVLFNEKFKLIDEKETEILHDLIVALKLNSESQTSSLSTSQVSCSTPTSSSSTSTATISNRLISSSTAAAESCPAAICGDSHTGADCAAVELSAPINNNCSPLPSPLHASSQDEDEDSLVKSSFSCSMEDDTSVATSVAASVTQVTAATGVHRPPLLSPGVALSDTRP